MNRKKLVIGIGIVILIATIIAMVFFGIDATTRRANKMMKEYSEEMEVLIKDKYVEQITKGVLFYIDTYSKYAVVVENANGEKIILTTTKEIYVELEIQGYYKIKVYNSQLVECASTLQGW